MLRKTRSSNATNVAAAANAATAAPPAPAAPSGSGPAGGPGGGPQAPPGGLPTGSPKDANKIKPEAGYDFIEGSGFVIEGLEDKGLDARSYIQMLRRTDGSSREEQIIQKVFF